MIRLEKDDRPAAGDEQSVIRRVSASLRAMEASLGRLSSAREAIERTTEANRTIAENLRGYYKELAGINKAYSDLLGEYERNRTLEASLTRRDAAAYVDGVKRLETLSEQIVDLVADRTRTAVRGLTDAVDTARTTLEGAGADMSGVADGIRSKLEGIDRQLTTLADDIRRGTTAEEILNLRTSVQRLTRQAASQEDAVGQLRTHLERMDVLAEQVDAVRGATADMSDRLNEMRKEPLRTIGQEVGSIGPAVRHGEKLLQDMQDAQRRQERSIAALLDDNELLRKELRDQRADNARLQEAASDLRSRLDKADREACRLAELVQGCAALVEERLPKKKRWFS